MGGNLFNVGGCFLRQAYTSILEKTIEFSSLNAY